MNLTPAAFKRFGTNGCVWLCQQCCWDANNLLTEAISIVNAAKMCFSKRSRDISSSTRSVDTQIGVKPPQLSSQTADSHRSKEERPSSMRSV
ncbi:unnamed protein product [Schistosoma curassoni]|nr:unnamed protein product [Schistosoma curassoni]